MAQRKERKEKVKMARRYDQSTTTFSPEGNNIIIYS